MFKKICISFLFSLSGILLLAKPGTFLHIEKNGLQWSSLKILDIQDSSYRTIPYFTNCIFGKDGQTPLYSGKVNIGGSALAHFPYQFTQQYFEPIPENEQSYYTSLNINDSLQVNFTISTEQKQHFLCFSFVPVRRNKQTGKPERLKYFVLEISQSADQTISSARAEALPVTNSVLNSGEWFKMKVNKSGVYQVLYSDLKDLGLSNPANVRIYGNGGRMLEEVNDGGQTTDLQEIPVQFVNGADGVFNEGDYVLFYAQGPDTWQWNDKQLTYEHQKHKYTDAITYFITSAAGGKQIPLAEKPSGEPSHLVTSYDYLDFHESDLNNLIRSGRDFYGELFSSTSYYDFPFDIPNLVSTEKIKIQAQVAARSGSNSGFQFISNNQTIGNISIPYVNTLSDLADYANNGKLNSEFTGIPGKNGIRVVYNKNGNSSALGWLDYIRIHARENLVYNNAQFEFRDIRSVGTGNMAQYTIVSNANPLQVWDVTDLNNTKQVSSTVQNNTIVFTASADYLRNYVVFDPKAGLLRPQFVPENKGKIANQNLHGQQNIDYIIITHPSFIAQANELAELHRTQDGLNTVVATTEEVFNEFSSGNPDPAAIRNYAKWLYDQAETPDKAPKYLLLFGDGSYDRKSTSQENTNYVLTYQSINSLSPVSSYVSDDYFGLLDNGEQIETGKLDIGVGRLPVSSTDEASTVVKKIRNYLDVKNFGSWRNQLCFIGDDEDNNIHMQQADQLADYVNQNYPSFNINKIYLDAYPQVSTSSGQRYPEANRAVYNQINAGALIMNYTGHGNEKGLTHEQVIRQNEDINQWTNKLYPLFVTATCEFSRFDDYKYQTGGEDVLLNPNGGGIALLTTTRVVYSGPNFILNQQFYTHVFAKDSNGKSLALGEIMRRTKNSTGNDINKLNFTLLGDPALKLAIPEYSIITDSINNAALGENDTIRAYQTVEIKGHIENTPGAVFSGFNGTLTINLFDKTQNVTTLSNDGLQPFSFSSQNSSLFKGKATVKDGYFKASIIVPRDIDYNYGFGKVSYYASNSNTDAYGNLKQIVVGGLSNTGGSDNLGPLVRLFLNDTIFKNGGISNEYPTLLAKVSDDNGINPGGNGIGHDIIAFLDNDPSQRFILNNYFQSDLDNFKSGAVEFQLPRIAPGSHTLSFKVWDIFNNSSEAKLNFVVLNGNNLSIGKTYNFPNPMQDYTNFFFEHNAQDENLDATIEIYSLAGRKIRNLYYSILPGGFTSGALEWDGKDDNGKKISPGVYIYQVIIRSNKLGWVKSNAQKIVVIN
ncbi:MAG TPA: type IX secretion system sortase PorU [Bacteroidales bacterium]|nr:type IX secretion system sortase PorU [Bacteroidales bacterium]